MQSSEDDLPLSEMARMIAEDNCPLSELVPTPSPASVGMGSNSDDIPLECLMQILNPIRVVVHVCEDDVPLNTINKTAGALHWERLTLLLLKEEELWRVKLRQITYTLRSAMRCLLFSGSESKN